MLFLLNFKVIKLVESCSTGVSHAYCLSQHLYVPASMLPARAYVLRNMFTNVCYMTERRKRRKKRVQTLSISPFSYNAVVSLVLPSVRNKSHMRHDETCVFASVF